MEFYYSFQFLPPGNFSEASIYQLLLFLSPISKVGN